MTTSIPPTINPHSLKKGDFVTVLEWTSHRDNSYKGDVLEVSAINLPFVVCKRHTGGFEDRPLTLDTRAVNLGHLAKDFVDAALGRKVDVAKEQVIFAQPPSTIKENTYVFEECFRRVSLVESVSDSPHTKGWYTLAGSSKLQWHHNRARPATHDEIKVHLIAEAEKRGIRVGTTVRMRNGTKMMGQDTDRIDGLELSTDGQHGSHLDSEHFDNIKRPFLMAQYGCGSCPVESVEVAPTLYITVDGKTYVPIFKEGYVEFGCARIANETFVKAYSLIDDAAKRQMPTCGIDVTQPNRPITSIRIGKGDFSPDLIAGIVAEIEKRAKPAQEAVADDGYDYYVWKDGNLFDHTCSNPYYVRVDRKRNTQICVYRFGDMGSEYRYHNHQGYWLKLHNRATAEALLRAKTS